MSITSSGKFYVDYIVSEIFFGPKLNCFYGLKQKLNLESQFWKENMKSKNKPTLVIRIKKKKFFSPGYFVIKNRLKKILK